MIRPHDLNGEGIYRYICLYNTLHVVFFNHEKYFYRVKCIVFTVRLEFIN